MGKLLKYEMKGTSRFLLGVLLALLIASSLLQYNIFKIADSDSMFVSSPMLTTFIVGISVLVIWGASLVSFFYIVNSFNKELSEDRGYLTFSLPLSGGQIVAAKLGAALIWSIILLLGTVFFNIILAFLFLLLADVDIMANLSIGYYGFNIQSIFNFILIIFNSLVGGSLTLLLVYFSMSLRRVSFGGKKMNAAWFLIFLVLTGLTSYISFKISTIYPYVYDMGINKIRLLGEWEAANMNDPASMSFTISVMNLLSNIVFAVLAFLGTSYLIDEKIDI